MNQSIDNLESVYEGNKLFQQDPDVEFIQGSLLSSIVDIKFSYDYNNIAAATSEGYRIFNITEVQLIQEDNIKLGQIFNIDFIDNLGFQLVIGLSNLIVTWDTSSRCVIKQYKMLSKTIQLNFCNPFIIAGFANQSIIVLNTRTEQTYRYLMPVQCLNKDILYMCNKNEFNTKLSYFSSDAAYFVVDCLQQQYQTGLQMKSMNVITEEQMIEVSKPNILQTQSQFQQYLSYTQVFATISDDGEMIALSPYVDKQRIYIYSQQLQCPLGQSKKVLSLFFGPNKSIACISFQSGLNTSQNDATLHLYYNLSKQQQDKESLIRIYFKTWSDEKNKSKRTKQTLVKFATVNGENKIIIYSGNNFYFEESLLMDGQLKQITIQDKQKSDFLH